jgi:phosphoribosylanthranilate isomerase
VRVRVKICGLVDAAAIESAVDAGADALGFVLAESPRRVSARQARELAAAVPTYVAKVAVLRKPDAREVERLLREMRPDALQLEAGCAAAVPFGLRYALVPVFHDHPGVVEEIAAWGRARRDQQRVAHLEGPGRGGRGVGVDRTRARAAARHCRLVIAGGLAPDNVADAIATVRPYAVDVSSGVESAPARKDPARIRAFIDAVRDAERALGGRRIEETP